MSVRNLSRRPIKVPGELKVPGDTAHDPLEPRVIENKLLKAICLEAAKTGMRENVVRDDEGERLSSSLLFLLFQVTKNKS